MLVEAIRIGYYGNKRIREGQLFNIKDETEFSEQWMKKTGGKKATKVAIPTGKVVVDFDQETDKDGDEIVI